MTHVIQTLSNGLLAKKCTGCGRLLLLSAFREFGRENKYRYPKCRGCEREEKRDDYRVHRDKRLQQKRESYRSNAPLVLARRRGARADGLLPAEKFQRDRYYHSYHGRAVRAANKARARALLRGAPGRTTAADRLRVFEILGRECLGPGPHSGGITLDHVRPLNDGGSNSPTNLQPLCRRCNSSKRDRSWSDYRTRKHVSEIFRAFSDELVLVFN